MNPANRISPYLRAICAALAAVVTLGIAGFIDGLAHSEMASDPQAGQVMWAAAPAR
jgi:hypothetical protein